MPERLIEEIKLIDLESPKYYLVTLKDGTLIGFPLHCEWVVKAWKPGDLVILDIRNWNNELEGSSLVPFVEVRRYGERLYDTPIRDPWRWYVRTKEREYKTPLPT